MATVGFGGNGGSAYTSWNTVLTSGPIGLPSGRAMGNGSTGCLMHLNGINVTGSFTAELAGSSGQWVGVNGGSANLNVSHGSSRVDFGRGGGGTTSDGHTSFAGTIGGSYDWIQGPSAPTLSSVTSSASGQLEYVFSGSGDDGGAGISTYRVEYATNASFTGSSYVETGSGTGTITGLTPGQTYYVRVAARNYVTDAYGTVGAYSATGSVPVLAGVRAGVGGAWKDCTVYAGINGAWVPCQVFAGRSGAWVGLTT